MIISHKHKFIFIKTRKTAGTSVEIALSRICGPDDVITPISSDDEEIRRELGYRTKQNYLIPFRKYSKTDFAKLVYSRKRLRFFNHMGASRIKKYIGESCWNSYYKFTFERNPFDKFISWHYWCGGDSQYTSIKDFITSSVAPRVRGFDLYAEQGNIAVDKVYRYENLREDLTDLSCRLGLDSPIILPDKKAKGNVRKDKRHYRMILSEYERNWISKVFAREIAHFGYQF